MECTGPLSTDGLGKQAGIAQQGAAALHVRRAVIAVRQNTQSISKEHQYCHVNNLNNWICPCIRFKLGYWASGATITCRWRSPWLHTPMQGRETQRKAQWTPPSTNGRLELNSTAWVFLFGIGERVDILDQLSCCARNARLPQLCVCPSYRRFQQDASRHRLFFFFQT